MTTDQTRNDAQSLIAEARGMEGYLEAVAQLAARPQGAASLRRLDALLKAMADTLEGASAPSPAALDVLAERRRQMEREGWTPEHDDEHEDGELSRAAAAYAVEGIVWSHMPRSLWPWDMASWYKPTTRRRNLVKAAALILAEIERLDRAGQE